MWTRMTGSTEKMWKIGLLFLMAQSIPSVPIPHPPGHMPGICHLVSPGGGEFIRKSLPGDEAFVTSSRSG